MRNIALRETFNFCFSRAFASINKNSILAEKLSSRLLFYEVLRFFLYFLIFENSKSEVVQQLMGQLVYTMFISKNRATFHLYAKIKLGKISVNLKTL